MNVCCAIFECDCVSGPTQQPQPRSRPLLAADRVVRFLCLICVCPSRVCPGSPRAPVFLNRVNVVCVVCVLKTQSFPPKIDLMKEQCGVGFLSGFPFGPTHT